MLRNGFLWFIILILMIAGCALPPPPPRPPVPPALPEEPTIRVGIVWNIPSIVFTVDKRFEITNHDGSFIAQGKKETTWRVEVVSSQQAETVFLLSTATMSTRAKAQNTIDDLRHQGYDAAVHTIGEELKVGTRVVNDNRQYRVVLKKAFDTRDAADAYRKKLPGTMSAFVVSHTLKRATGTLRLINTDNGQEFISTKPIHIRNASVTIHDVPVGTGFHWASKERRTYPETISFQIDNEGQLAIINILSAEEYLKGVVPSEMHQGFPLEALKAQAVAARSEAFSKLGIVHKDDPFDICADVHCQVYSGLTKNAASTDRAVRETRGRVLWDGEKICNAVYSAVCGGHTEDNNIVWGGEAQSYLRGGYDGSGHLRKYSDLSQDKNVRKWIDDNPPAYCNTTRGHVPEALDYTKKYFRWEVKYTQQELRDIIQKKSGRDIGDIIDLKPLARGSSGRISKLDIVGTRGDIRVERELNIRRMLSDNTLWNACFYVEKDAPRSGVPAAFVIRGAGWGHGVGMCQTGAAMMALRGVGYERILQHYYEGVKIKKLY